MRHFSPPTQTYLLVFAVITVTLAITVEVEVIAGTIATFEEI